jgi:predicted nuclease with TOPRIM domain
VWLLRTTWKWIVRDVDLLKPIFERMRGQGDLLDRNAVLAEELRRTFPEIDRIEKELTRASKAIQSVSALVVRYRDRLRDLCDTVASANARTPVDGGVRQNVTA